MRTRELGTLSARLVCDERGRGRSDNVDILTLRAPQSAPMGVGGTKGRIGAAYEIGG